jgi:hypothetical protein
MVHRAKRKLNAPKLLIRRHAPGHAYAAVLLLLSLVVLRYVDEAKLPSWLRVLVRNGAPAAAVLLPAAFFLSILSPSATQPTV